MSKINAVRLINLNYNNNAIHVSDEVFHMNGESTLISLRNGGGKSVLVQMIMAPFVHKRYRDAKDRPFESYFNTNKPTFILVEWVLDHGAGYVMTGMMVRRSQEISEQYTENLEIVNFISEYKERCIQDIFHLPVVEKGKKELRLSGFGACKQLFESYKKDHTMKFTHYDMSNAAQSRQYFEKLTEYQIHYKEWETIIKKVNLKESGLSDLFSDCRDEKGLVEKWFLDAVESKLNKDKNRMHEFRNIIEKYVQQYKDNKSKIQRRDTIRKFKEEAAKINEQGTNYHAAALQEKAHENTIAVFISELNRLLESNQTDSEAVQQAVEELQDEINYIEYERISSEIHKLREEERYQISNRDMIEMEREELERECETIEEKLHLLACAKQQAEVDECRQEYHRAKEKLEVSRQEEKDLEPERKSLGYTLQTYYRGELSLKQELADKKAALSQETAENSEKEKEKISGLQNEVLELTAKEGAYKARIQVYDEKEEEFNRQYQKEFVRNILGEYEPGELEIHKEIYQKELENKKRERLNIHKQMEDQKEKQRGLERTLSDKRTEQVVGNEALNRIRSQIAVYEQELLERKVILRYLNLEEKELFLTDKILLAAERKIQEIEAVRKNLEKEENQLESEWLKLTKGKILELPKEFEEMLENLGIQPVYGMEWLQKNGRTTKENEAYVRNNPFLPYAVILSGNELQKLKAHGEEIPTSLPIPIILREGLEKSKEERLDKLVSFENVSFYMLFNNDLLDENKLQILIEEKEAELKKKRDLIERKKVEYREYFEKLEKVKNQSVSQNRYDEIHAEQQQAKEKLTGLAQEIKAISAESAELKESLAALEQSLKKSDETIQLKERQWEAYQQLCSSYAEYLEQRRDYEHCKKEISRLTEQQKMAQTRYDRLLEQQKTLERELEDIRQQNLELKEKYAIYADYQETQLAKGDKEQLEARYQAITAAVSLEIQELEAQAGSTRSRYNKETEELEYLRKKYHLSDNAWHSVSYNRKEEMHQETLLEDKTLKIAGKQRLWNEEDKKAAVTKSRIGQLLTRMQSECKKDQPLPQQEIKSQDFEARINQLIFRKSEEQKRADQISKKLQSLNENLTALSEYNEFVVTSEVDWEVDFQMMNSKELRDHKGILIRDYNADVRRKQEERERLQRILNQVVRMEEFGEDFYKKPIENLIELSYDAEQVMLQLKTIIQSYDNLMEKLEIDISLIEGEREKIIELLEEYVHEVHTHIGRIDQNSTITIRSRPIKMLKIKQPIWEENQELYQLRLRDYMDEITAKGIEIFEQNENAQEFFGRQITTKQLFDTVIGIGNVQIQLYKIEEQREYPITWADVAKNSGGEGFLSAFIILSSLLYYMRKDDTDLFADRNEGKVLIMDNPFAQTNAAHLLKPLMDIAKKTNTQLICLSGLGGESIYNRFDNIYVLNLIAASLRNGMQYLRADHRRGEETETIITSQIEVMEQQELIF